MLDENENSRKKLKKRSILLVLVLVLSLAGCIIGWYIEKTNQQQERGVPKEDIGELKRIEYQSNLYIEKPALTTILLMGIDKTSNNQRYSARQGGQADFLMVFVIDHKNKTVYQLQIDRDTMTNVTVYGILGNKLGTSLMQICLSHGFGATIAENEQNTVNAVQNLLQGVTIDHYLSLNLESIGVLNDALGGVAVTLADDFTQYDPQMAEGATITLNALQAEIFTRYRIEVGDGSNENRMIRQRTFMSAAGELFKERITDQNKFTGEFFDALNGTLTSNMSRGNLINEINAAYQYEVLPIEALPGDYRVSGDGFMEFYVQDDAAIQWILRVFCRPVDNE